MKAKKNVHVYKWRKRKSNSGRPVYWYCCKCGDIRDVRIGGKK
jgi:hypothetical protein